jgi:hypothetical protein
MYQLTDTQENGKIMWLIKKGFLRIDCLDGI